MEIFGWKIFEKFYSIKINSNVEIFFLSKKFISLLSIVNNETTTDEIHCILSTMEIENFCRRLYIFFFFHILFNGKTSVKISLQDILYVITNFLTIMISFVKIIIIMIYKKEFIDMILYMEKNFWNVKYDFQEEEILNNYRKTCIFFVTSVSTIGICAMISYTITPIIGEQNEISIIFFLKFANLKENLIIDVLHFSCGRIR